MNKGHINREIFVVALLSGKTGVEAIMIAGSRATNNNSRSVIACRVLRIVKKEGVFINKLKGKMDLILSGIDTHDLNSATLREKALAARHLGEIANKLLK